MSVGRARASPRRQTHHDKLDEILRRIHHLERLIMALSANEQQAVNDLASAVNTLASDLADVESAAQANSDRIAALIAQGTADAATITELQAIQASQDADVVGALAPITQHLSDMDAGLTSPATPDSPLSATP